MYFFPVMAKKGLLHSSVSHDPSEVILICRFAAQKTFLKTVLLFNIFWERLQQTDRPQTLV